MNICWEILGIEPTTDLECIRQAYLALLPSFHPESDPQGFKRLRQAYEEAQHWAASPAEDAKMEEVGDEHEILVAFRELLASERDRFQPSAWQKFIQQLNQCSMDEIDKLRWQLCDIAMKTETISLSCLALLAQRLNWQPQEAEDDADGEELEAFLETVKRGDAFDLLSLAKLPLVVQDQTDAYFFKLEHIWRFYPEHFADALQVQGAWIIPMINSCIVNYYTGLAPSSGAWRNWSILLVAGRPRSRITKMRTITCANSVCSAVKGKACWPTFAISGSVIPPRRRTTCCWAGAASIGLISSRWR